MFSKLVKCITPNCPNTSYYLRCLTCSAQEVIRKTELASVGICAHGHSITGDYSMIKRLLPEYQGGEPQPGYMLDVCNLCLQELDERPYNPARSTRGRNSPQPAVKAAAIQGASGTKV